MNPSFGNTIRDIVRTHKKDMPGLAVAQLTKLALEVDDTVDMLERSASSPDPSRLARHAIDLVNPENDTEADRETKARRVMYDPRRAQVLATLALAEEVAHLRALLAERS